MFFENAYLGKNQFWRYLLTLVIFCICFVVITFLFILPFSSLPLFFDEYKNLWLFTELAPFAVSFFVLLYLIKFIHKKPILSVLTSRSSFDFKKLFFAAFIFFLFTSLAAYILLPSHVYQYDFNLTPFIKLFAISIFLFPLQCALEEVIFRGYFLQAFGRLFKNKLISLFIVSILFAALHLGNPEFNHNFYQVMAEFLLISFFLGIVTVLDNGLEVAIGLHIANNLFLALILSLADGTINTDAIFTSSMDLLLPYSTLLSALPTAVCFGILYYKYSWRFSTLFEPIKAPNSRQKV